MIGRAVTEEKSLGIYFFVDQKSVFISSRSVSSSRWTLVTIQVIVSHSFGHLLITGVQKQLKVFCLLYLYMQDNSLYTAYEKKR